MEKKSKKPTPRVRGLELNGYEVNLLKELRRIGYGEVTVKVKDHRPYQTIQPVKSKILDPSHYKEE